ISGPRVDAPNAAPQFAEKPAGVPRHADVMRVRNNKGNVFVGNLPPDFSDERLAEAFDPFGIVLTAAVARDPSTGARLRYGFVDIATERAMTQAITALDGSEIDGCKLNVKPRERAKKAPAMRPHRPGFRGAPSTSIARLASSAIAVSNPAATASTAEKNTQKSVARPHTVTRSKPRSRR